jgi:hypothetical protein
VRSYNNTDRQTPDFGLEARMIFCYAFVPLDSIDAAFRPISGHVDRRLQPILDWFEDYYIGSLLLL